MPAFHSIDRSEVRRRLRCLPVGWCCETNGWLVTRWSAGYELAGRGPVVDCDEAVEWLIRGAR
jgi:hypothetical protein